MKKLLIILIIIAFNILKAQESTSFSNFDIGFYGGINFYNIKNIRGDILVELKTDILSLIKLKASIGYFNAIQPHTYTVRKYSKNTSVDTIPRFFATKYDLVSKDYDVFSLSLGMQYNFVNSNLSPYISIEASYNYINSSLTTTPPEVWSYNSLEEIPTEFKGIQKVENFPDQSYGIILGVGTSYQISSKFNLDIRYLFRYDSKIINTHHFLVGIYF